MTTVNYEKIYESIMNNCEPFIYQTINKQNLLLTVCLVRLSLNDDQMNCTIIKKGETIKSFTLQSQNLTSMNVIMNMINEFTFCLNKYCLHPVVPTYTIDNMCSSCHMMSLDKTECDSECAICLEKNNVHSLELFCGHIFHKKCLLKTKKLECEAHFHIECSLCRADNKLRDNVTLTASDDGDCLKGVLSDED